jgi:outer membrane protein TolC
MRRKLLLQCILFVITIFAQTAFAGSTPLTQELKKGAVLPLRSALARGIQKNLDLRVTELDIPITDQNVVINDAEFDPVLKASISSLEERTPTPSTSAIEDRDIIRATGVDMGLRKKFRFGLESELSFETSRSQSNSSLDALRPQYRDALILDFTQPLLRDFGTTINTANLKISQNEVRQAAYGYMGRAQGIGEEIEIAYYDLARALEILRYRIESRELARELLEGNKKKFDAGVVPVTEVQEAETAVASRDEQVVFARQQVEIISNRLKDLLEIRPGDPLYEVIFVTEPAGEIDQDFPDLGKALGIALEKRPDLQQQRLELANREIRIEYYANQKLPRIDLESTLGVNGLSGGLRSASFAGAPASTSYVGNYYDALSEMSSGDGYEWYLGLRFSYPFGNRAAQARHRRATQEKRQSIYFLKRLEGTAETQVKNALVSVQRSIERVRVTERFEKLAQTTLAQEMERLKKGLSDTFRILDFQDNLIESHIRKVTALGDFNKGLANLYRATGTNLERFNILVQINTEEISHNE